MLLQNAVREIENLSLPDRARSQYIDNLAPGTKEELPYLPVYKSTFFDQKSTEKNRPRLIHRVMKFNFVLS